MTPHQSGAPEAPLQTAEDSPVAVPIPQFAPYLGASSREDTALSVSQLTAKTRFEYSRLVGWFTNAGLALIGAIVIAGMSFAVLSVSGADGVTRNSYRSAALLDFSKAGNVADYLRAGWGPADKTGRWTRGDVAQIIIPLGSERPQYFVFQFDFDARVDPRAPALNLQILANGATVLSRSYSESGAHSETFTVAADPATVKGKLVLTFLQDSPVDPVFDDGGDWLHLKDLRVTLGS